MDLIEQGIEEQKAFIREWPLERLKSMTLDEYSNSSRESAFVYWLEQRTENTGSIWGGSSFKFGIYKRKNTDYFADRKMARTDGVYAWLIKYGLTKEEAFENVKATIIKIASESESGNFEVLDDIDLGEATKWKIAFLYNPINLIPIFNRDVIENASEGLGKAQAFKERTSALQRFLSTKKQIGQSTREFASILWNQYNKNIFFHVIQKFITQSKTDNLKRQGFPTSFKELEVRVSFGAGNTARVPWIAFLKEPNTVTDGIYPVFLYYKSYNTLILAYGLSETHEAKMKWSNSNGFQTVSDWFNKRNLVPDRYGSSFVKGVYDFNEEVEPGRIESDLNEILDEYKAINNSGPTKHSEEPNVPTIRKYWLIAPGENATKWEEFYDSGTAGIGWVKVGNLRQYTSKEEIKEQLMLVYPEGSKSRVNQSLCLWQFSNDIKVGDIIIAKKGTSVYLGYGEVTKSYFFDETNGDYPNLIKVNWKKKGIWEEAIHSVARKTLTEISEDDFDRISKTIGIDQEATLDNIELNYFWLNINPAIQKVEDFSVGDEWNLRTHNKKQEKTKYENFKIIKPRDIVLAFETMPIQKVIALLEVTMPLHLDEDRGHEIISMKVQKFLPIPIDYSTLRKVKRLNNNGIFRQNYGTLHRITKEEYSAILEIDAREQNDRVEYTELDAEKEIFLENEALKSLLYTLQYKKNIILQGPPGVGKTYLARRIAYLMMKEKDKSKVEMVQFHQSYSYEDFIQGYRPKADGSFKLENGIFYRFCKRAEADLTNNYFFIIDEINRGNLSKIFGELMLLIELDKRGREHAISLTYSTANENKFSIPPNVFLIGSMNTSDRSLALVDYALRRRFGFVNIEPNFSDKFKENLLDNGVDEGIIGRIVKRIAVLNKTISEDPSLGDGFLIGHSYFCNVPDNKGDESWYQNVINNEIAPLLREFWCDRLEKAEEEINRLIAK